MSVGGFVSLLDFTLRPPSSLNRRRCIFPKPTHGIHKDTRARLHLPPGDYAMRNCASDWVRGLFRAEIVAATTTTPLSRRRAHSRRIIRVTNCKCCRAILTQASFLRFEFTRALQSERIPADTIRISADVCGRNRACAIALVRSPRDISCCIHLNCKTIGGGEEIRADTEIHGRAHRVDR